MRTKLGQKFVIEVTNSDWVNGVRVVHPFEHNHIPNNDPIEKILRIDRKKHPLHTAIKWKAYMVENRMITGSVIAQYAGVTSGRIRQMLRLNNLDESLKDRILDMDVKTANKLFPESKLRK